MKHKLTIILLLCSIGVFGQTEKIIKDSKDLRFNPNNAVSLSLHPEAYPYFSTNKWNVNETFFTIMSDPKVLLKVTESKDSLKVYKVWFDKKAITWTSDSTFTLRVKL